MGALNRLISGSGFVKGSIFAESSSPRYFLSNIQLVSAITTLSSSFADDHWAAGVSVSYSISPKDNNHSLRILFVASLFSACRTWGIKAINSVSQSFSPVKKTGWVYLTYPQTLQSFSRFCTSCEYSFFSFPTGAQEVNNIQIHNNIATNLTIFFTTTPPFMTLFYFAFCSWI